MNLRSPESVRVWLLRGSADQYQYIIDNDAPFTLCIVVVGLSYFFAILRGKEGNMVILPNNTTEHFENDAV